MSSSVVLPEPFGPTRPVTAPARASRHVADGVHAPNERRTPEATIPGLHGTLRAGPPRVHCRTPPAEGARWHATHTRRRGERAPSAEERDPGRRDRRRRRRHRHPRSSATPRRSRRRRSSRPRRNCARGTRSRATRPREHAQAPRVGVGDERGPAPARRSGARIMRLSTLMPSTTPASASSPPATWSRTSGRSPCAATRSNGARPPRRGRRTSADAAGAQLREHGRLERLDDSGSAPSAHPAARSSAAIARRRRTRAPRSRWRA
jgi:hypothetical protein